ncbi:MAG: TetR/AcrR family transcriptional regulator [Sandaracinaceae bacterium]
MSSVSEIRRARERRQRREAILDAAERVFTRDGVAAATMEGISEEAEVSKGTLYLYFASKDDLFLALADRSLTTLLERFEAILARPDEGRALVRSLLEAHASVMLRKGRLMRRAILGLGEGLALACRVPSADAYAEALRTLREGYRQAIARGIEDGSVRDDLDPGRVAASLWAALLGATFFRVRAEAGQAGPLGASAASEVDPRLVVDDVMALLLRALGPPERASRAPSGEGTMTEDES